MRSRYTLLPLALLLTSGAPIRAAEPVACDLLIVGGNESGVAAAIQAVRLGVPHVVLVNDIEWLGGQFSAEGVGCLDEWTTYRGKRVNFPRSGLFLEIVSEIRKRNATRYGITNPGNAWCGTDTIEPAAAAKLFADLIAAHEKPKDVTTGRITHLRPWEPVRVRTEKNAIVAVEFISPDDPKKTLVVTPKLTIDCSDWGDVIRLSGAKYAAGPDLKKRFGEPGAPEGPLSDDRNEMNPLSWCVVLREAGKDSTIAKPEGYDPRSFASLDTTPPFVDWDGVDGVYSKAGWSIYTHRRLVDRRHNGFAAGTEATFLNWPVQDYPLYGFPKSVADALEATESGASKKNLVDMTTAQRKIVFADAKRHTLGMLYHLQTKVHDRVRDYPESFRYTRLTDEFGTPDRLPPKPYVREGLRLEALYMLRETDIRAADRNPRWAKSMVPDGVFGFQFNIDFHPTRRKFLDGRNSGPWQFVHTANRNWHTDTDRAMLPLRSLVPVEVDGLLGSSKNIGVTSLVSAAVRVHGQMVLCGQAAGTVAAVCLKDGKQPREIARDWKCVRDVQRLLVRPPGGAPGVLLWPYHDLGTDDQHFESVNHLAVRGIWPGDADSLDFRPHDVVTKKELVTILGRVSALVVVPNEKVLYVPIDRAGPANWKSLSDGLTALGLTSPPGLAKDGLQPLQRYELARVLWAAVRARPERLPDLKNYLKPENDADEDGIPDLEDPLPFTKSGGK
ncbi:MAG: FAD-dependent oxidoreductase [Planctomycetes bacterium]|nr:FAD-dependent oxidoreductase [Planctomycetota bacterium]